MSQSPHAPPNIFGTPSQSPVISRRGSHASRGSHGSRRGRGSHHSPSLSSHHSHHSPALSTGWSAHSTPSARPARPFGTPAPVTTTITHITPPPHTASSVPPSGDTGITGLSGWGGSGAEKIEISPKSWEVLKEESKKAKEDLERKLREDHEQYKQNKKRKSQERSGSKKYKRQAKTALLTEEEKKTSRLHLGDEDEDDEDEHMLKRDEKEEEKKIMDEDEEDDDDKHHPRPLQLPSLKGIREKQMTKTAMTLEDMQDKVQDMFPEQQMTDEEEEKNWAMHREYELTKYNDNIKVIAAASRIASTVDENLIRSLLPLPIMDRLNDPIYRTALAIRIKGDLKTNPRIQEMLTRAHFFGRMADTTINWVDSKELLEQSIADLIHAYYQSGQLEKVPLLMEATVTQADPNSVSAAIDFERPDFWSKALAKNMAANLSLENEFARILRTPSSQWETSGYLQPREYVQSAYDNAVYNRLYRQNNLFTDEDYINAINKSWHHFDRIFSDAPPEEKEEIPDPDRKVEEKGDEKKAEMPVLRKDDYRKNQHFLQFEEENLQQRKKMVNEFNMLMQNLRNIENDMQRIPNSVNKNILISLFNQIKENIKNGSMTIKEAYSRINTLNAMKNPMLEKNWKPPRGYETKKTIRIDEQPWRDNAEDEIPDLPEDKVGKEPQYHKIQRKEYYNKGLFSLPYLDFSPAVKKLRKVGRNTYDLTLTQKNILQRDIERVFDQFPELYDYKQTRKIPDRDLITVLPQIITALRRGDATSQMVFKGGRGGFRYLNEYSTNPNLATVIQYDADPGARSKARIDILKLQNILKTAHNWLTKVGNQPRFLQEKDEFSQSNLKRYMAPGITEDQTQIPVDIIESQSKYYTLPPPAPRADLTSAKEDPKIAAIRTKAMANAEKFQKPPKPRPTYDNVRYSYQPTAEYPESFKTEYKGALEFKVKTAEDLLRMKNEITKLKGTLYIIDLRTGRLYPISLSEAFVGAVYVFKMENSGGSLFAHYTVKDAIHKDSEDTLPYEFMRNGNDKIFGLYHKLITARPSGNYTHQMQAESGAGLWKYVKKKMNNLGNSMVKGTVNAANTLAKSSKEEYKNFVTQETKNVRNIYQSGSNLVRAPSWKSFQDATIGVAKLGFQPIVSTARETANVSNAIDKIPGMGMVKFGAEMALPPLAIVDHLSQAVKSSGVGSNDKPQYLQTVTNLGDALIGSQKLSVPIEMGARVLNTTGKIADAIIN